MRLRYRVSGVNIVLGALALASSVGIVALFSGASTLVRVLAVLGVAGMLGAAALFTRWALTRDRARIALFASVRHWDFRAVGDEPPATRPSFGECSTLGCSGAWTP